MGGWALLSLVIGVLSKGRSGCAKIVSRTIGITDLITTVPAPKHTQHTAFHTQLSTHSHILSVPRARPGSKHKAARVFTRSRPQSGSTSRTEIAYALGQRDGFLLHPLAEQLVRCVEHGARRTRSRWCARSRTRCHLAHAHGARAVLSSEDRHESGGQRHPWSPQPLG